MKKSSKTVYKVVAVFMIIVIVFGVIFSLVAAYQSYQEQKDFEQQLEEYYSYEPDLLNYIG